MSLRVFNSLSGQKEPLVPIRSGRLGMYVCGPTVYDAPHLGHARSAVVFDVINRYLRAAGYAVTYVRNITDIDDRLIERARRCGRDFQSLGAQYTDCYRTAMQRLNVHPPDQEPRATDYIPQIQSCIEALIHRGHAYCAAGSVYFAVESCSRYGRLSGRVPASRPAAAPDAVPNPADENKRHPADFALWKAARAQEPAWPSPWGPGRPGWHIECSAMSAALLGAVFDIHGGGADLIFPHHENEIAQSESLSGQVPARYWLHHGLVQIRGEKMAKSLGNGLNLADLLDAYAPGAVRLFLLSRRYRHPLDYSVKAMRAAGRQWLRLERFVALAEAGDDGPCAPVLAKDPWWRKFCEAMDDDFNFPGALAVVFEGIRAVNRQVGGCRVNGAADTGAKTDPAASALLFICSRIFGFERQPREAGGGSIAAKKLRGPSVPAHEPVNWK